MQFSVGSEKTFIDFSEIVGGYMKLWKNKNVLECYDILLKF